MKKYTQNFIVEGNIVIEFSAKNDKDAIEKAQKLKKLNNISSILKQGNVSVMPTIIEDEAGKPVFNMCTGEDYTEEY